MAGKCPEKRGLGVSVGLFAKGKKMIREIVELADKILAVVKLPVYDELRYFDSHSG